MSSKLEFIDRRTLLQSAGAAIAVSAAAAVSAWPAMASARHHAFKHGAFDVTVLSDGHLVLPASAQAQNIDKAALDQALALAGQSGDHLEPAANITLLRRGAEVILVDAGAGPHFMPTTGKLPDSMKAAGIDPKSVTLVVFTHAHPDHIWGTLDDFDESPLYPNAQYVISAPELDFWLSPDAETRLPEDRRNFAAGARRNLARIKERLRTVVPGGDVAPGIRAIDTAGHTAGHISLEIAGTGEGLVVLGDALIHPVISFQHPEWRPAGDHHDPAQAVQMRRRLLDRLATDKVRIVGHHLPFPGLGRVERKGAVFQFAAG